METTSIKRSFGKVVAALLAVMMLVSVLPMSTMAAGSIDYSKLFDQMDASDVTAVVVTDVEINNDFHEGDIFTYGPGNGYDFSVAVDVYCGKDKNGNDIVYEDVTDYDDLARLGIYFDPADGTVLTVEDHDEALLKVYFGAGVEATYATSVKKEDRRINVEPGRVYYTEIEKNIVKNGESYVIANGEEALSHKLSEVNFTFEENLKKWLTAETLENVTIELNDEMIDFDYVIGDDIIWTVEAIDTNPDGVTGYVVYFDTHVNGVPYRFFLGIENILSDDAPEAFDGTVSPVRLYAIAKKDIVAPENNTVQYILNALNKYDIEPSIVTWYIDQAKNGHVYTNYFGGLLEYTDYIDLDSNLEKGDDAAEEITCYTVYYNEKFYLYFDETTDTFKAMWDGDTTRMIIFQVVDEKSPLYKKWFYVDGNSEIKSFEPTTTQLSTIDTYKHDKPGNKPNQERVDPIKQVLDALFFDVTDKAQASTWKALELTGVADFSFYTESEAVITSIKVVEQPNLVYNEGDRITVDDISTLVVDVYFNGGLYVKRVPFRLFDAYNIEVYLQTTGNFYYDEEGTVEYSYPLSYAYDNNGYFAVTNTAWDCWDTTEKITVLKSAVDYYEIADKLANGEYVILTKNSSAPNYDALTVTGNKSDVQLTTRVYGVSSAVVSVYDYLNASYAKTVNDRIDTDRTNVGKDSIWSLVRTTGGWYIINSNGEYLSRYDYDVIESTLKKTGYLPLTTVSTITDEELVTWQISGSKNGYIYSEGTEEQISYYLTLGDLTSVMAQTSKNGLDTNKAEDLVETDDMTAYYVTAVAFGKSVPSSVDTFTFYGVHYSEVASVEVYTQPTLTYKSGDALDLSDLAIKVTYKNGAVNYIKYANFTANGVTTNYANGAVLTTSADNGKSVVVTYNGKTGSTKALTVSADNVTATVTRLYGATRFETAVAISEAWTSAETVVVANAYSNVDALAAAPLAYAIDAPILLVDVDNASVAAAQAKVLGAKNVIVIGGTAVVSDKAVAAFEGMNVTRIAGETRIETSVAIAKALAEKTTVKDVFVVGMNNSADALTAGAVASIKGAPIVYVGTSVDASVAEIIKGNNAVILGGTAAVSNAVETEIKAIAASTTRIAGETRYETSANINATYVDLFTSDDIAVALGADGRFCDALAGSVYAAKNGMPVVLVDNGYANTAAYNFVSSVDVDTLYVFGGDQAVADATIDAILGK